jgi:hypothetical protein
MINLIIYQYDGYDPQAYYYDPSHTHIPADFDNQYQYQYNHYPQAPPPLGIFPTSHWQANNDGADLDSDPRMSLDGNQSFSGFDNTVSESPHDSRSDVDSTTMNLNPSWNYMY